MSSNNEMRHYGERLKRLYGEMDDLKADIKEFELEAQVKCNLTKKDFAHFKKWLNAERKDKIQDRIDEVVDAATSGEMLGHTIWNDSRKSETAPSNSSKEPREPEASATEATPAADGWQ